MAEFQTKDKVGYTNNEKMLDEIFDLKKAFKIFLFQNDLNNCYLALMCLLSETEGGLIKTLGNTFDATYYDAKKDELNKLMRDYNNDNLSDDARIRVLNSAKFILLEVYTKINKQLWASNIIFKLEEGFSPKKLTG